MVERFRTLRSNGLAKETSWALVGEAMTIVVLTVSFTLLGRQLGPDGYGAFVGLYGLLGPAIAINHSAVGLAIYEHVVGRQESGADVGASCFSSTLLIGAVLSAAIILLGSILLPALPIMLLVLFALGELVVNAVLMMAIAIIQAVRSFTAAMQLRILATSMRGAFIVALAVFDQLDLRNLAIGQIVAALLVLAVVAREVLRHTGEMIRPGRFRRDVLKSIMTYATGIAGTSVQIGGDKVVLNTAGHVADAGLYGAAYRIIMMALVPVNALSNSTHLRFLDPKTRDPVGLCLRYSAIALAYAVFAASAAIVCAPLVPVLLGSEFEGATSVIRWLTPIIVLSAVTSFPANGLLTYERNPLRTKILLVNAAFAVALYVALIPPFSWRGAVIASVISEATMTVTTWTALLLVRRKEQRKQGDAHAMVSTSV